LNFFLEVYEKESFSGRFPSVSLIGSNNDTNRSVQCRPSAVSRRLRNPRGRGSVRQALASAGPDPASLSCRSARRRPVRSRDTLRQGPHRPSLRAEQGQMYRLSSKIQTHPWRQGELSIPDRVLSGKGHVRELSSKSFEVGTVPYHIFRTRRIEIEKPRGFSQLRPVPYTWRWIAVWTKMTWDQDERCLYRHLSPKSPTS